MRSTQKVLAAKNGMIVRDIFQYRSKFQISVYVHERREANLKAHRQVRMATTLEVERHIWMNDPPDHFCIPVNIYMK
jgi:hypothetical protein